MGKAKIFMNRGVDDDPGDLPVGEVPGEFVRIGKAGAS